MADQEGPKAQRGSLRRRHLVFGWCTLLLFLSLGLVLDGFHGFKVGWYLDADNETRRTMWTLCHAHGTLLGLVHLAFASALRAVPDWGSRARRIASWSLIGSSVLLPGGFFLGGLFFYGADPGLGGFLIPVGGLLLLVGVGLTAWGVRSSRREES